MSLVRHFFHSLFFRFFLLISHVTNGNNHRYPQFSYFNEMQFWACWIVVTCGLFSFGFKALSSIWAYLKNLWHNTFSQDFQFKAQSNSNDFSTDLKGIWQWETRQKLCRGDSAACGNKETFINRNGYVWYSDHAVGA